MGIAVLPSSQFDTFNKDRIASDVSNFKNFFEHFPSQFYIKNHNSGQQKLFLHEETHRDSEGEVTHVTYFHPGDARIPRVTLWND